MERPSKLYWMQEWLKVSLSPIIIPSCQKLIMVQKKTFCRCRVWTRELQMSEWNGRERGCFARHPKMVATDFFSRIEGLETAAVLLSTLILQWPHQWAYVHRCSNATLWLKALIHGPKALRSINEPDGAFLPKLDCMKNQSLVNRSFFRTVKRLVSGHWLC